MAFTRDLVRVDITCFNMFCLCSLTTLKLYLGTCESL